MPLACAHLFVFGEGVEVLVGGSVEELARRLEARAVAGAVPRMIGIVPAHDAAEVWAHRRQRVQRTVFVAIHGELAHAFAQDGAGMRCNVLDRVHFAVKLPRSITHEGRLRHARAPLYSFLDEVAGLGEKLGPLLVQLPPSLAFEARVARAFFALLRKRHAGPVVCEPRHASWFGAAAEEVLSRFHIGRVAADPACVSAAARPGGWLGETRDGAGATVYYRLRGSPRMYWSIYPTERIAEWATALHALPASTDAWCIFDNTAAGGALQNALALASFDAPPAPSRVRRKRSPSRRQNDLPCT